MLRVFNNTARYVDQGGNKRPGAFAIYLEPWHADVFDFLELRKNHGSEEKVSLETPQVTFQWHNYSAESKGLILRHVDSGLVHEACGEQ